MISVNETLAWTPGILSASLVHRRGVMVLLSTLPKPSGRHTPHHWWATSITSRCPVPGPASRKARIGNRARTPSPIVV